MTRLREMNTYKKLLGLVLVLSLAAIASGCTTKAQRQDIIINNATQYMSEGNYAQAIELLNEGLTLAEGRVGDKEIDICYYKAAAQYNSGDYEGAIKTYTALANYDEEDPNPLLLRGSVYLKSGEKATALNDYKAAIALDEDDYDMYIAIYENLAANNFIKEGEEFLNIALEKSGESADDCLARGRIYTLMKQYDAAETAFKKANDKGAEDANIYLANLYYEQGDEVQCDKLLEEYKKKDTISALACNAIASMELKRNHPDEALEYVEQGLGKLVVDNKKDLLRNKVACLEALGRFEDAFNACVEFLDSYPQDVDMGREKIFISTRL